MAIVDREARCGRQSPESDGAEVIEFPGAASPREPVSQRRGGTGCLGVALVCCGIAMLPWLLVLANSLPAADLVPHWSTAWVGLDALEALGLATTGLLLLRRDPRRCLTATATAVLLIVDFWFDVTTSTPGAELATAIAMGLGVELPMATLCTALAVRSLPHPAQRS
jgi:hypothetical protein